MFQGTETHFGSSPAVVSDLIQPIHIPHRLRSRLPSNWQVPPGLDYSNPHLRIVFLCYCSRATVRHSTGISISAPINRGNVVSAVHRENYANFSNNHTSIFSDEMDRGSFLCLEHAQYLWESTRMQSGLLFTNPNLILASAKFKGKDNSVLSPRLIPSYLNLYTHHLFRQWIMGQILYQHGVMGQLQCLITRIAFKHSQKKLIKAVDHPSALILNRFMPGITASTRQTMHGCSTAADNIESIHDLSFPSHQLDSLTIITEQKILNQYNQIGRSEN
jgi:hypothetical protein